LPRNFTKSEHHGPGTVFIVDLPVQRTK